LRPIQEIVLFPQGDRVKLIFIANYLIRNAIQATMRSTVIFLTTFLAFMGCAAEGEKQDQEDSILESFSLSENSNYRGLSAVSNEVCWFSGSGASVYRIDLPNQSPIDCSPTGVGDLDFRDIQAFDAQTALLISAGLPAVILRTEDGGRTWSEVYRNEEEGIFFDAMDFWDAERGMAFSDARGNELTIIHTEDGGRSWKPINSELIPQVHENQGGFAASGTVLKTFGEGHVIIGLGGVEATVLISTDYGQSWHRGFAPIDQGEESKGIFSFSFIDEKKILVAGGDYRGDSLSTDCMSISFNGGYSWKTSSESRISLKNKYLSNIIAINENEWFAHSRFGSYFTNDAGLNWRSLPLGYYSGALAQDYIWLSGAKGAVARLPIEKLREQEQN
jgi:photosystem II stability/assembly factor-like uncharacterized protein